MNALTPLTLALALTLSAPSAYAFTAETLLTDASFQVTSRSRQARCRGLRVALRHALENDERGNARALARRIARDC